MTISESEESEESEEVVLDSAEDREDGLGVLSEDDAEKEPSTTSEGPMLEEAATPPISSSTDESAEALGESSASGSREIGISSVVHLMGLATKKHLDAVEQQISAVSTKIDLLGGKFERISSQLQGMQSAAALDRLDAQLSDIQKALKEISRVSGTSMAVASVAPVEKRSAPKIIVSRPQGKTDSESDSPPAVDSGAEQAATSAVDEPEGDPVSADGLSDQPSEAEIEFQRSQAEKVRKEREDQ